MVVVYAHAMNQPIPADEISPADSGALRLLGIAGLILITNDGMRNSGRIRTLASRLVLGVGVVAVLGIVQTLTSRLWVDQIRIPGLSPGTADWTLAARSGLARPSGTSTHPIEYGMILTTTLPLAIVFARSAPRHRLVYRVALVSIAVSTLLSISRSAIICAVVAILLTIASWPLMAKLRALAFSACIAAAVFLIAPGVLGTIANLFTGINNDASVQSRTGSYDVAAMLIGRNPLLGRGFGTFLPRYWILDNGYLGLLIEGGVLGILGLLALLLAGVVSARRAARLITDPFHRQLALALGAAICAGAAGLAFFDTFAFPQSAGVFFLLIGMAGAAWRLARRDAESVTQDSVAQVIAGSSASRANVS
jgi:O-antigen ligase